MTRDPIGYQGGLNLYGFAGNNPVNESDPNGTSDDGSDPFAYFNNLSSYATPHDVVHAALHNDVTRAVKTLANIYGNFAFPEARGAATSVEAIEVVAKPNLSLLPNLGMKLEPVMHFVGLFSLICPNHGCI